MIRYGVTLMRNSGMEEILVGDGVLLYIGVVRGWDGMDLRGLLGLWEMLEGRWRVG